MLCGLDRACCSWSPRRWDFTGWFWGLTANRFSATADFITHKSDEFKSFQVNHARENAPRLLTRRATHVHPYLALHWDTDLWVSVVHGIEGSSSHLSKYSLCLCIHLSLHQNIGVFRLIISFRALLNMLLREASQPSLRNSHRTLQTWHI